ncbi:hypothetical protein [Sediminitomix flava]|uniref:Uncharacterized protein n=1 Tax=Sediminitomix flava TaxID=379075 RepID=A0A315YUP9_SEDFL|nr:hypothetical protein [Sediminitomix flava]PWJ32895.1 hypothetical protein BC781_1181 [Sediminitomix flava]
MVTVEEALKKGKWQILYPSLIICFGGMPIIYLSLLPFEYTLTPILSIFLPPILALLYASIITPKWKIWAYSNVDNVHLLYLKAVEGGIISNDNSSASKLMIMSASQRMKLNQLNKKVSNNKGFVDVAFKDNPKIPKQIIIYKDKLSATVILVLGISSFCLGLYLLFFDRDNHHYHIGVTLIFSPFMIYTSLKKRKDNQPQLTLNKSGIKIKGQQLIGWRSVIDAEAYVKGYGKGSKEYLKIRSGSGVFQIDIGEYNTSISELNNLIYIYRGRSKQIKKA